jgi:AraC-like DNA-binding protein
MGLQHAQAPAIPASETTFTDTRFLQIDQALMSAHTDALLGVIRFLDATIEYSRPTARGAAAAASMNLRSLQRRLASCGMTFTEILDEYRQLRAFEYLQNGDHSVTSIAFRLGYSDSGHFTRAFRRWTGSNPRDIIELSMQANR